MPTLKRDLTIEQKLSRGPMDLPFLMLVVMLTAIGVITVFSASFPTALSEGWKDGPYHYFIRQAIFAVGGIVIMYFVSRVNYQSLRWLSVLVLAAAIVMLVVVLVFHTKRTDNVKRWIPLGPLTFQPSEAAKLGVILYFSARMSKRQSEKKRQYDLRTPRGVLLNWMEDVGLMELVPYIAILGVIAILMYFEPHLSGVILIFVAAAAILFAGGVKLRWFGIGIVCVGVLAMLTLQGYQGDRIVTWRDPWADPQGDGFQIIQSLYSIGSGGLFGLGFGQGRQKQGFLPEAENDFIFSVWCEEMGLVGACIVLILFMLLVIRGYWIALHARDRFGALLVVGITTLMAAQVFLNISVVTNLLPTTGISLPFFSYGGTALMIQLAEMGIVLGVSRQIPAPRQG